MENRTTTTHMSCDVKMAAEEPFLVTHLLNWNYFYRQNVLEYMSELQRKPNVNLHDHVTGKGDPTTQHHDL